MNLVINKYVPSIWSYTIEDCSCVLATSLEALCEQAQFVICSAGHGQLSDWVITEGAEDLKIFELYNNIMDKRFAVGIMFHRYS